MKNHLMSLLICLCLIPTLVFADTLPDGGQIVLAPQPKPGNNGGLNFAGRDASMQIVPKDGGGYAYRVTVDKPGNNRWDVQLNMVIPAAIREENVYLVRYDARCIESMNQEGTAHANVEKNGPPHSKTMSRAVDFGTEWTTINLPFVVRKDFAFEPNGSVFTLHLGAAKQVIELANIQLIDFGNRVAVDALPKTRATYTGMAADAPWRKEAAKCIDQYRKANLQINVLDAQGKPVKNAKVHIAQQRHDFAFGTAMNIRFMNSRDERIPMYEKALLERFNAVVFENGLKWFTINQHTNEQAVAKGIDFVKANDLYMRGHVLIWPSKRHTPRPIGQMIDKLKENPNDQVTRDELRKAVEHRITWITRDMAGKVDDWDVANETFANHDVMDVLDPQGTPHGKGVMVDWFKLAHAGDPNAKLFLNDYGILTSGNHWNTHQEYFYQTIKDLQDAGAPIHGIGMQSHFGASLTSPTRLWEILDHYSQLGLRIKVTEFDMNLDDDELKADYTRDFFTAMFAHPQVDGLLSWGFWAGQHWRKDAAYLDMNFKPRSHDIAMRKLLFEDWWTNTTINTAGNGNAKDRVFKGQYLITVTWPDEKTTTQKVNVTQDKTVEIKR
jgi:GH35 family endo-1,4-beta-xylanase